MPYFGWFSFSRMFNSRIYFHSRPIHIAVAQGACQVVRQLISVMAEFGVSLDSVNHQRQVNGRLLHNLLPFSHSRRSFIRIHVNHVKDSLMLWRGLNELAPWTSSSRVLSRLYFLLYRRKCFVCFLFEIKVNIFNVGSSSNEINKILF